MTTSDDGISGGRRILEGEPLYRLTFDAGELAREHPPKFRHPHKAMVFELACPADDPPAGRIEVTRWAEARPARLALPGLLPARVTADYYTYAGVAGEGGRAAVEWHVNFADPRLFGAYGSGVFAQDEMQAAEHPVLACVREALLAGGLAAKTSDENGATPILVTGVERRVEVRTDADAGAGRPLGLYGNHFAAAPAGVVRQATRRIRPATLTNLIAIAAPSGGRGEYTERQVAGIFATAFTGFAAAHDESVRMRGGAARTVVHTGFWGCGAFGGQRRLMVALQALAARAAGVSELALHAGDPAGAAEARAGLDVGEMVAGRCGSSCTTDTLIGRVAMLGYRWGVSDGN